MKLLKICHRLIDEDVFTYLQKLKSDTLEKLQKLQSDTLNLQRLPLVLLQSDLKALIDCLSDINYFAREEENQPESET